MRKRTGLTLERKDFSIKDNSTVQQKCVIGWHIAPDKKRLVELEKLHPMGNGIFDPIEYYSWEAFNLMRQIALITSVFFLFCSRRVVRIIYRATSSFFQFPINLGAPQQISVPGRQKSALKLCRFKFLQCLFNRLEKNQVPKLLRQQKILGISLLSSVS